MGFLKEEIRERIWRLMEERNIARFPRPVYGRIPNFVGAEVAASKLLEIREFRESEVVKVNPDSPQKRVRELVLELGKKLLVPTPRIREGFLLLNPKEIPRNYFKDASTIRGAFRWGRKVSLRELPEVDFIVVGSVAVNLKGYRLGKGEGYSEFEYGILVELGRVKPSVPIATTVHDVQVLSEDFPVDPWDYTVDYIVTPTRIIRVDPTHRRRPAGILWEYISDKVLEEIPVLKELKGLKQRSG